MEGAVWKRAGRAASNLLSEDRPTEFYTLLVYALPQPYHAAAPQPTNRPSKAGVGLRRLGHPRIMVCGGGQPRARLACLGRDGPIHAGRR